MAGLHKNLHGPTTKAMTGNISKDAAGSPPTTGYADHVMHTTQSTPPLTIPSPKELNAKTQADYKMKYGKP